MRITQHKVQQFPQSNEQNIVNRVKLEYKNDANVTIALSALTSAAAIACSTAS